MTNYNAVPATDIRNYIWNAIKQSKILNVNDYYADGFVDPLIPIIPAQQVPEFNNMLPGKTYMFYDFEVQQIPVQWWMLKESFTITIMCQNYEVINQINNLIIDLFRRYDESASDINSFLSGNTVFKYHDTSIDNVKSPEPFDAEGDFQYGSITFSYKYSRITGSNGRF
jgi:hypothetical protein